MSFFRSGKREVDGQCRNVRKGVLGAGGGILARRENKP